MTQVNAEGLTFRQLFFRYSDRKIGDGSLTFSQLGINKNDFTRICTEDGFAFDDESLERICTGMKLTDEEREQFIALARAERAASEE